MRSRAYALLFALCAASACENAPHEYPAAAQSEFHGRCPADNPVCVCTWEKITRAMPYEEYEAAMARFRDEGLMDPKLTRISVKCREEAPR